MSNLPDINLAQRPRSRSSDVQSMRGSVTGSRIGDDARSLRSGVSKAQGSAMSATSSVVNMRRLESLRGALIQKLLSKYNPGIANSKTEAMINWEVDELIKKGRVTEEDLRGAEARIRKQSNAEIAYIATNPFKLVVNHKSAMKDEWDQMNKARMAKGMMQDQDNQDVQMKRRQDFKKSLAAQVKEVENRRMAEQLAKQEEAQRLAMEASEYKLEQDQKMREHARKIAKMKIERDEHMIALRKKKEEAKLKAINEDRAAMEKLRQLSLDEAKKQREIKEMKMEKLAAWKKENEQSMAEKERLKQIQVEKEKEMLEKAKLALDEAELKRVKEFEELKAKMKAKEAMGEAMGADRQAQIREDEERMIRAQKEFDIKVERELKAKKDAAEAMKLNIRKSLDKQVRDRIAREKRDAAEREKQARIDADKAQCAMREAERKEQDKRKTMEEYRLQLEDQARANIRDRPGRDRRMTEFERDMNRQSLDV